MENIADRFWDFVTKKSRYKILSVLIGAFILRLPTLFIDFIHVDIVTSYLIVKRDLAGLPFNPNKGWLYHYLYKYSIILFGDSPSAFHFTGILFILMTVFFIYLLGKKIYNEQTGIAAGMFYGFIISSYNTEFMATNAEVIYNLFFVSAFYFFYIVFFEKKNLFLIPLSLSLICACLIKFQGLWAAIGLFLYISITRPIYTIKNKPNRIRYYALFIAFSLLVLILIYIDWNYTGIFFKGSIRGKFTGMSNYVANRGFDPVSVVAKLLWRGFHFTLYHSIIWIPGILYIYTFLKSGEKKEKDAYVVFLTVFLFLTIFLGGARLSVHYFIPVLPVLSIHASSYVLTKLESPVIRTRLFKAFVIPVLFFFLWNIKDVYVKNFNPGLKHNESAAAFLFRIVFVGSHGEYLLPHKSVIPVIDYLKNNTGKDENILVWPMATEIAYYSNRKTAEAAYWYNENALYAIVQNEKGNTKVLNDYEKSFIIKIKKLDPDYFVDAGSTEMIRKSLIYKKKNDPPYYFNINDVPMIRFGSFGSLDNFPEIIRYLNENFEFKGNYEDARVWKKIKPFSTSN